MEKIDKIVEATEKNGEKAKEALEKAVDEVKTNVETVTVKAPVAQSGYEACIGKGHTPAECWTIGMPEHVIDDKIAQKVKEAVKTKEEIKQKSSEDKPTKKK